MKYPVYSRIKSVEFECENNQKEANNQPPNSFNESTKTLLIAGIGFLLDAYDIFVIGMVLPMVYQVYFPSSTGGLSSFYLDNPFTDGLLKTATYVQN